MPRQPVFTGLVFDQADRIVDTVIVGEEAFYVVNDAGFHRHIPSIDVDRQVLDFMRRQMEGHEEAITDQTAKMLGGEDLFTRAIIQNQLKNLDQQFEQLLKSGIPEDARAYLGMMGFRITVNIHGDVTAVIQPSQPSEDDEK